MGQISILLQAAHIAGVRVVSVSRHDKHQRRFDDGFDFNECRVDRLSTPWDQSDLGQFLSSTERPSLLFAGSEMSDVLCQTALNAYVNGYDVFCMTMVTQAQPTFIEDLIYQRLRQTGIVVMTMSQVLSEWAAHLDNSEVHQRLLALQHIEP